MKTQFGRAISAIGVSAALIVFAAPASPALAEGVPAVEQTAGTSIENKAKSFTYETATAEETKSLISHYLNESKTREATSFNLEAAQKDGASEDLLEVGRFYNSFASYYGQKSSGVSARGGFPVHGNWCGPGHSGPGEPVDTLDRLCMEHDQCYAKGGYFNKACDMALVGGIYNSLGKMNAGEKAQAIAIATFFSI